ncbi:MAG: ribosome biogenesis GTPase Der [Calditrichaeota bacterium]|nr:MAG: ribosome biogenesis GTPase Der [Calditrichota bacterium]
MKKPIVAIVGRPNVGKSTLFNRIIRKRVAIVDDQPGVTRDRHYATTDWAGVDFDLLDTGGYVPSSNDIFEQAIRKQVNYALYEADLVIFLTDATTGITPLDIDIAEILQKSGKKTLLVVNKVDNEHREDELYDFFQLGLGDPLGVSAIGGRAVGDFLDRVVELLPKGAAPKEQEVSLKLAILGRPNVGKSSFVNAVLGQDKMIVTEIAGTTRDSIDTRVHYQGRSLILIDTAGLRKRARVNENIEFFSTVRTGNAIERCDVAVVMIDATELMTDQDKTIIMTAADLGKGVVIAVNKWDLIEKDSLTARRFEKDMQDKLRDLNFLPIMFISALTKQRIYKVLEVAFSVHEERMKRLVTADLNRWLQEAIEQHHPPAFGTKWVKINYVTQTKISPPLFIFFTNEPKGIKKNYRNYLENKLREQFGFFGVPIRLAFRRKNK